MKGIKFCDLESLNIRKKKKKIFSRNSTILDYHVGKTFNVHIGNKFFALIVTPEMKGLRFGDFCLTRKFALHKKKKK